MGSAANSLPDSLRIKEITSPHLFTQTLICVFSIRKPSSVSVTDDAGFSSVTAAMYSGSAGCVAGIRATAPQEGSSTSAFTVPSITWTGTLRPSAVSAPVAKASGSVTSAFLPKLRELNTVTVSSLPSRTAFAAFWVMSAAPLRISVKASSAST